jgi:hypothetical protein
MPLTYFNVLTFNNEMICPSLDNSQTHIKKDNGNICQHNKESVLFILYNAEICPMWKIFLVPCGSTLYKFHCINKHLEELMRGRVLLITLIRENMFQAS